MRHYLKRIVYGALLVLWMLAVILMIQNYRQYPPLPPEHELHDRINNTEGVVYKYIPISFIELTVGLLLIHYLPRVSGWGKAGLVLVTLAAIAGAFVDAMFAGGVPAIHAWWMLAYGVTILLYTCFISLKGKTQKAF